MGKTKWAPNLPHMPVREFISDVLHSEASPREKSEGVCKFLGIPYAPVTSDIAAALSLIPDCWFHISHLEVTITPTAPVKGAESVLSNGGAYDRYGRPVGYTAQVWKRELLPQAICEALLKAKYDLPTAFVVEASEKERALNEKQWWERSDEIRARIVDDERTHRSRLRRLLLRFLNWHKRTFLTKEAERYS